MPFCLCNLEKTKTVFNSPITCNFELKFSGCSIRQSLSPSEVSDSSDNSNYLTMIWRTCYLQLKTLKRYVNPVKVRTWALAVECLSRKQFECLHKHYSTSSKQAKGSNLYCRSTSKTGRSLASCRTWSKPFWPPCKFQWNNSSWNNSSWNNSYSR